MSLLFTLSIFVSVYVALVCGRIPKHFVVLSGALALLVARIVTLREALTYINGQTLLWLFGLFIAIEILDGLGFFEWLAFTLVNRFAQRPAALFFALPLLAGCISMAVNNITVMAFMTTLTLTICRTMPFEPVPLLIGEVACANMMGAATLIGAPPNLIMATTLGYGFQRVTVHMAPIVVLCTAIFMLVFYFSAFPRHFPQACDPIVKLRETQPRSLRVIGWRLFLTIDYETLVFFAGLFILIGALEHVGLFQTLAQYFITVHNPLLLMFIVLWGSAIVSAFVDNVPMAVAMAYVIKQLSALSPKYPSGILVWAALVGLTLGGTMTPIGASPNIVAYGILARQKIHISWRNWSAMTVPPTLCALGAATLLLWLKFRLGWY